MDNCKCNGTGFIEDINGINILCSCGGIKVKPIDSYVKVVLPKTEVVKDVKKTKNKR